jgi:tetratricopeptide (TPR) repeat protein
MQCEIPEQWEEAEKLGARLRQEGRLDDAAEVYRESLRRFPGNVVLLNGLGLVLLDANHPAEAVSALAEAVRCAPQLPALAFNLGNALRVGGDPAGAVVQYERAMGLGLDIPELFNNLGVAWQECERWDDALGMFQEALRRDPRYLPALANSGYSMMQSGRPDEAVGVLRRALQVEPGYADAHWLLSHALLVTGQWPDGWDEYEWRWHRMKSVAYHRGTPESRWKGEDLGGKTILLYAEQGAGDAVQFVRYVPLVKARGGSVVVECHEELVSLFRSIDGVSEVYARGAALPRYDVVCPLLSLPSVFRTTVGDIPGGVPYLFPDPHRAVRWRRDLGSFREKLCIGLVWAGSAAHVNDRKRSVSPGFLAPLAAMPGVQLFSLQKGASGECRGGVPGGASLVDWTDELHDFADTAALMSELDLVITVDTAVAHIAGALGRPVWVMVPFAPDWRWLLHGGDTGWYPTMRLFRQPVPGDWHSVVASLCRQIGQFTRVQR